MSSYKPIAYPPPPPPPPPGSRPLRLDPGPPPPLPKALRVGAAIAPAFDEQKAIDPALSNDDDMLTRIAYPAQKQAFWTFLSTKTAEIEAIVSDHMRVKTCRVGGVNTWISGSFNVCIPVYINPACDACVLIRIPLPYKVGEAKNPGNVDEKLRCEAATYMWIQQESPTTPIPKLYGCGFPDGQTVSCKTPCYGRCLTTTNAMLATTVYMSGKCAPYHSTCLAHKTDNMLVAAIAHPVSLCGPTLFR